MVPHFVETIKVKSKSKAKKTGEELRSNSKKRSLGEGVPRTLSSGAQASAVINSRPERGTGAYTASWSLVTTSSTPCIMMMGGRSSDSVSRHLMYDSESRQPALDGGQLSCPPPMMLGGGDGR